MSTRALYYPHTNITSEVVLKNALLLWDKVDIIVPRSGWTPRASTKGKLFNEGLELVVVRRAPSEHERLKAHQGLQAAMKDGVLTKLAAASPKSGIPRDFPIYPSKFMERTWHMLRSDHSADDALPSFFCRYMILRWLRNRFKTAGTGGLAGYFPKREVKHNLLPYGLSPEVVDREFNYLLAGHCIVAEHLRTDSVDDDDLVRIGPAGFVHLDLICNVNYLAAVAEDTFFEDRIQAERIAARIKSPDSHLHIRTAIDNAEEVVTYLEAVRARITPESGGFFRSSILEDLAGFSEAREALNRVTRTYANDPWFDADKRLPRGSLHRATVINVVQVGYFVEFNDGLVGLVHRSKLGGLTAQPGDLVQVEVQWVDVIQRKMGLRLNAVLEEDVGDNVEGAHSAR